MLTGKTNEEKIWNYLKAQGLTDCGVAGLMGNLYAESGLNPKNLQNTYEKKLGYTDETYTAAVDGGGYTNFAKDSAGYGLAQWTYWSRKENLLKFARAAGKSVGDLETQLAFLLSELGSYGLLDTLKAATSVKAASDTILLKFEKPASMNSETTQTKRAGYGQGYYDKYTKKPTTTAQTGGTNMSNSSLVTYTKITKNKNSPRNHAIDTITIHCIVGQWTAKQGCDYFASTERQCSANYVVGKDGSIGLSVDEKDRSWCSSNASNDHRAITIEVASDTTHPYAVTDKAYAALLDLVTDICRRNGIKKLLWKGDKSLIGKVDQQNMTVHRWFANKACPGDYLYSRHGAIAEEVNRRLGSGSTTAQTPTTTPSAAFKPYTVRITSTDLNIRAGAGTNFASKGYIKPGVYTIVEESAGKGASKWGKLKSGAGWISLDYCKRV